MAKTAEIFAIGTELLGADRLDTNSLAITEQLNLLGVEVVAKHVLGDDRERLAKDLRMAIERSNIVITRSGPGLQAGAFARARIHSDQQIPPVKPSHGEKQPAPGVLARRR